MPLSQSVHEQMSQRLQQAREDLLGAVRARTDADEGDAPSIAPGAHTVPGDDRPTAEMISHDEAHLAEHDTNTLHEIDAALGKLANGGAGICESCGCEIPDERLLATPTVRFCIACQDRIEKESGIGRGPTM
ncbi:TraR/DksA family transcriptional regulator [Massilia sp. YIM B02443]|uniref:TraR/DksA family transcriptional regulator n=1 Tax=Massilia sp. YIM B02443 TaxID=3050127 RepID=UPI0025B6FFE3|nr:TraR/DksA family transcriptional regulator [Massilia sp. YIM B02443]MDN4039982.1 TraR/DksA family transcriptional regulator [Massilia sp. YIM B02443]